MPYLYLVIAIAGEVIATSSLKASEGFTRLLPSVVVVVGYGVAFYFLSLTLKSIPIGTAYAIWSGLGIVLVASAGWLVFGQKVDLWGALGMGLIVAGVVLLNFVSKTSVH
ncbi:quaternary ammonium compound efflux SMR transporter QacE delta 1 [Primorskyibacter flagellatus]|uniref:Quaternary ammonium compound efflux SMR transporter QacE delta 1 n=1 Tax=Primorskyibacter flagellatus TaxID=1387277 RepID=A0A916ZWP7_9RHOB|nr:multidrug efflux SMR transporter [Primorskyibacter flagellatus]GGE17153.1 quaternary ammonium compound efflux SMR transporter QacE delta 1 [Primorskyibacter flagellatus]